MVTSVSREALAMDEKTIGSNDIKFENSKGVFLKRKTLILSVVLGVLVLVSAILITFFSAKCEKPPQPPGPVIPPPVLKDVRLPSHILPSHYDIELLPNITGDLKIIGHVVITMDCVLQSSNITLHKDDLTIDERSVTLKKQGGNDEIKILSHTYDSKRQFYIIKTGQELLPGQKYTLDIKFEGSLTDKLAGFYLSKYSEKEEEHKMAVTQFQATDARKAFPCFDEPKFKAEFSVKLARPKTGNWISLSNMKIKSTESHQNEGWVWDVYEKSVKMSTYLVAFVVAEFEYVSALFSKDRTMGFYARPSAKSQLELAKSLGPNVINFYESYFSIPFPLEKCDMIAVPDFNAGAMENWGLVTYREATMLFDPAVSTASNNQRVAVVIAHELAHQWFGNLVTPYWWTDLWLNEGFASFVEYLGVDAVRSKWKMSEQFIIDDLQDVLELDALVTSHPISQPVLNPDEITELFDRISYGKGASIIRMMYKFLGENGFKQGVTAYLNELKYSNSDQDDLWRHLSENSDNQLPKPVKDIMDTWTLQAGYPVVQITRDYKAKTFQATQRRFVLDPSVLANATGKYKWWVYLTWTSTSGREGNVWMSPEVPEQTIQESVPEEGDWLICNVDQFGFFRVNYDKKNWDLLKEQLKSNFKKVNVINRGQILDDSFELAKAGQLDYETALDMTVYLKGENEYVPTAAAFGKLSYIELMLSRKEAYGPFKTYMQSIIEPLYNALDMDVLEATNYEDIDITQVYRSTALIRLACQFEAPRECITNAVAKFKEWKDNYNPDQPDAPGVPVNMKRNVYCTAIREGTIEEWDFLYEHYTKSNLASEKRIALDSLTCTETVWILSRYLEWILDPSKIRRQDGSAVFQYIAMNKVGRYLAFDFMRNNWDALSAYYSQGIGGMDKFVTSVSHGFNTDFEIQELKAFEKAHENTLGSATRATKQAIEAAENNFNWMVKNYDIIHEWLKKQSSDS